METPKDLLEELNHNEKWLDDEFKCSKYYREYLSSLFKAFDNAYKI